MSFSREITLQRLIDYVHNHIAIVESWTDPDTDVMNNAMPPTLTVSDVLGIDGVSEMFIHDP